MTETAVMSPPDDEVDRQKFGGTLQLVLTRFTLLDDTAARPAGSVLVTDRGLHADWGRQPDGTLTLGIALLAPDLETLHFACGGTVDVDEDGDPIAWAAPDTAPASRLAVDMWSANVVAGAIRNYYRWSAAEVSTVRFGGTKLAADEFGTPRVNATVGLARGFCLSIDDLLPAWERRAAA